MFVGVSTLGVKAVAAHHSPAVERAMVGALTAHVEHQVGIDDVAAAEPVVEVDSSLQK